MKLGPVTKLNKKNRATSKKIDDDVMLASYDVIVIFVISGQFGAIWKLDSGRIVSNTTSTLLIWVEVLFLPKNADFLQKKYWHQKK